MLKELRAGGGGVYLLNPYDMTTALKAHGKLLFLQGIDVFEPTV